LFFLVTLSARLNLNLSLNFNNMHKLEKRKDIFRARKKVRPLKWIAVLLCLVLLASCSQDEDLYDPLRHEVLPAVIDTDQILDAGTHYWLTRTVCVTDSATLTILPGTLITADPLPGRQKPALVICSGSRIVANGTEDAPVVLTSAIEEPGSWGGLTVLGQAPVNNEKTDSLCPGTTFVYGGEKEQDDSGLLYFVRVEYAGATCGALTFKGVGSGTDIDHCQSYRSEKDGFSFLGGTVNARYLVSTSSGGNGFSFQAGYTGKLQFVLATAPASESVCSVMVSNGTSPRTTQRPYTCPVIANFSVDPKDKGGETKYAAVIASNSCLVFINSGMREFFVGEGLEYQMIGGQPPACPDLDYILINTTPQRSFLLPERFRLDAFFVPTNYEGAVAPDREQEENWTKAEWVK
jgi:hypothetical protein